MTQLLEYQAKNLLESFGLKVPRGERASDVESAVKAAQTLGYPVMVKAQVPIGGRGKAGAIRRANDESELRRLVPEVLATPVSDLVAREVLIESCTECVAEIYLAVTVSGLHRGPVVLFTGAGGLDVESSGSIETLALRESGTVPAAALRQLARAHGLAPKIGEELIRVAEVLARAFLVTEARLIELNPIGVSEAGSLLALDARIIVDDSALPRQKVLQRLVSERSVVPAEEQLRDEYRLEYVPLGGNIGLISGGAGMTMAAMDLIETFGGQAACFLDCSANPTPDGYGAALRVLEQDPKVETILISIFGGLTQVDRVARTLVALFLEVGLTKPVVCRLMGSNVEGADAVFKEAGRVNFRHLEDAVKAAVGDLVSAKREGE